ncbi:MAG: hypothetical protein U0984_11080 [Prosthecobacter sp.]|nr:hypothetical protein [Prosthecobacter sp.]
MRTPENAGRSKRWILAAAGVALLFAGVLGWWLGRDKSGATHADLTFLPGSQAPIESPPSPNQKHLTMEIPKDIQPAETAPAPVRALHGRLNALADELRKIGEEASLSNDERQTRARDVLNRLRDELRKAPADIAAAAILQFLDAGTDAATGLGFVVEAGGVLADAPSMRTGLLDILGQLDPAASVDYAQKIFGGSQVADEWALAMRNLGWQNQDGAHTAELRQRLNQMLDNQAWLGAPSQGYLEAFDTAVHLGGVQELLNMASVTRLQNAAGQPIEAGTTHAAYVALDRIITQKPAEALTALANDPALLAWAPEHRAALMARADVSDAVQRAAVETYLQSLAGRPEELQTFVSVFPNRNGVLGNALITTRRETPVFAQIAAADQAALSVVRGWQASGRYAALAGGLEDIAARLAGFVSEAAGGN